MFDPLSGAAKLFREALHIEFRTPPGKYNWGITILFWLLVCLLCVTDVFKFLLELLRVKSENWQPDFDQLFWALIGIMALCMSYLVLEYRSAQKNLGPPSKGRHRKDD